MSEQDEGSYDLQPPIPPEKPPAPKPGDPDFVPPTPIIEKPRRLQEEEQPPDPDVANHKGVAILGYLLFVIPLVLAHNSKFARFHANQALLVFIVWCCAIVGAVGLTIGWSIVSPHMTILVLWLFFGCIANVLPVALVVTALVFTVMGIINAANGEQKPLPFIGHLSLIKVDKTTPAQGNEP